MSLSIETHWIYIFLAIGVAVDVVSCSLLLRKARNGRGSSGIPMGATLISFFLLPMLIHGEGVLTNSMTADILIICIFHLLLVFLLRIAYRKIR